MNLMEKYKARIKVPSEERRKTLDMVMEATILHYRDQIIKGGRWTPSEATKSAEKKLEEIQADVMAGHGRLEDFRAACEEWQRAGVTYNKTTDINKEERQNGANSEKDS